MSDGPHKSLPMSRAWKKFTECGYNRAFSREEVSSALVGSLEQDWRKGNMERLVQIVGKALRDGQTHFFSDQGAEKLKLLRREAAFSPLRYAFLDFLDIALAGEHSGDGAIIEAASYTLSDLAARRTRQVKEHCLRKMRQRRGTNFRQRIEGAIDGLDIAATARHLLGLDKNKPPRALAKRTGLDDGVRL